VVVDTADTLLVAQQTRVQDVGKIVKALEDKNRKELL
jgi:hypothetical protein